MAFFATRSEFFLGKLQRIGYLPLPYVLNELLLL